MSRSNAESSTIHNPYYYCYQFHIKNRNNRRDR